jgi:polar amino acid transport system substrate-binding protein
MRYPFQALYAIFLSALTLLLITSPSMAAPMLVTGSPEGPPISWKKHDALAGVGPTLATKILTELNVEFTISPQGSWQEVQDKAKEGTVDMLVSAYENNERRTYMDYSVPYLKSPVVIVVKKGDKFPLSSWKSLAGKKGVANTGESFGEKLDAFIKSDLQVSYVPYQRAFKMLAEDVADYLIIDLYPALVYSKLLQAEDKIEFLDKPVTIQYFHMTISKKSPYLKLLPEINKILTKLKEDKYIKRLAIEQYKSWHKTFQERQRFYARQNATAAQEQSSYDASARDRGLEHLGRFIERDMPYMDGSNFH